MEFSSDDIVARINTTREGSVWEIKFLDEKDKLVCISRCTVAVVDRPPDNGNLFERQMPSFG